MTESPTPPRHPPPMRTRVVAAIVVGVLALAGATGLGLVTMSRMLARRALPTLEESRSRAQILSLGRYVERRHRGSFLPPHAISIAIREAFLQRVLDASLPIEQTFDDGRYRVRLDHVRLQMYDGAAVVTLTGRGRLASDTTMYADLLVQGTAGLGDVDYERSRLEPRIEITNVNVIGSGPPGLGDIANPVAAYFGRQTASDWNAVQAPVAVPVQLAPALEIPATQGDVTLPATRVPLRMRLAAVTTLEGRMVASVEILPDTVVGGATGPPLGPWDAPPGSMRFSRNPFRRRTRSAAADSLRIVSMRDSVHAIARTDSLWRAVRENERDIVVVVPGVVLDDLAGRMTQRYREGALVDFRPELKEHVEEKIRVKMLVARVTAGTVRLDIHVHHLKGRIATTREPELRLVPPDGLALSLPARVMDGEGTATFDAAWEPKAYASVVCRGFETHQTLSGVLAPLSHTLEARVRFVLADGRVEALPRIEREKVRLRFDLTERSWERVRQVFVEQDEFLKCGMAIDPDRMVAILRKLGAKGVRIRLPGALPRFTIPVTFAETVEDSLFRIDAELMRPELAVRPDHLRFGFDADFRVRSR